MGGEREKNHNKTTSYRENICWYTEKPQKKKSNIKTDKQKKKLTAADIQLQTLPNVYYIKTRNHKTRMSINKLAHPGRTCQLGNESCGWVHSSWCGSGAGCTVALPRLPAPSAGTCERGAKGPVAVGSTSVSQGLRLEVLRQDPPPQYSVQPGPLLLLPVLFHWQVHHQLPQDAAPVAGRAWMIQEAKTCYKDSLTRIQLDKTCC